MVVKGNTIIQCPSDLNVCLKSRNCASLATDFYRYSWYKVLLRLALAALFGEVDCVI